MKNTQNMTCLQYVINGMNDKIFSFTSSKDGKNLIAAYKKLLFIRENQIKELLIAYNCYFMVQAAMQLRGSPKSKKAVIEFMASDDYSALHDEVVKTVTENYPMLWSCMKSKQKRKIEALFQ